MLIQQPPGAKNWCIGCTGRPTSDLVAWQPDPDAGDSLRDLRVPGVQVRPASLYLEQLRERLGESAVKNIGYGLAK